MVQSMIKPYFASGVWFRFELKLRILATDRILDTFSHTYLVQFVAQVRELGGPITQHDTDFDVVESAAWLYLYGEAHDLLTLHDMDAKEVSFEQKVQKIHELNTSFPA